MNPTHERPRRVHAPEPYMPTEDTGAEMLTRLRCGMQVLDDPMVKGLRICTC